MRFSELTYDRNATARAAIDICSAIYQVDQGGSIIGTYTESETEGPEHVLSYITRIRFEGCRKLKSSCIELNVVSEKQNIGYISKKVIGDRRLIRLQIGKGGDEKRGDDGGEETNLTYIRSAERCITCQDCQCEHARKQEWHPTRLSTARFQAP